MLNAHFPCVTKGMVYYTRTTAAFQILILWEREIAACTLFINTPFGPFFFREVKFTAYRRGKKIGHGMPALRAKQREQNI